MKSRPHQGPDREMIKKAASEGHVGFGWELGPEQSHANMQVARRTVVINRL